MGVRCPKSGSKLNFNGSVFGLATIGLDGFSMVANHWSNDGMVTIHRYGLELEDFKTIERQRTKII